MTRTPMPPAWVPLAFFAAAGVGLSSFGFAGWFAADRAVVAPTHTGVVSAVHTGVLAFLTMAMLGVVHFAAPVLGGRPLRSVAATRVTWVGLVGAGWILPTGFAHGPESLVVTGGLFGAVAVLVAAWNLSGPLTGSGGAAVMGLRVSLAHLVVTVGFGVVYAFDRQTGWFPLLAHRVLAHAHLGLVGWLGLAHVALSGPLATRGVSADRSPGRAQAVVVGFVGLGTGVLAAGLLLAMPPVAWIGAIVVVVGLGLHLRTLATIVRSSPRPLELLHRYLAASAASLIAAVAFAAVSEAAVVSTRVRVHLVAAEVLALMAWVSLAVVGYAHTIVPMLVPGARRHTNAARLTFLLATGGFATAVTGLAVGSAPVVAVGGVGIALTGVVATANLTLGARRVVPVVPARREP